MHVVSQFGCACLWSKLQNRGAIPAGGHHHRRVPGAVLEAQTLFQLQTVRMETMGGAVVAVGMFRELGPVITGLMLAGRVGSAMAAEIGTMKVTEQVDALKSTNVDPVDYLVKPADTGHAYFHAHPDDGSRSGGHRLRVHRQRHRFNVDQAYWMHFMSKFVTMGDIIVALVKALAFGLIISTISCREGLNTTNGAVGVGKSTMQAMVYASVALLIANFILTMILNSFFPMGFMR